MEAPLSETELPDLPAPLAADDFDLETPRPDGISDREWQAMQREIRRMQEEVRAEIERFHAHAAEEQARARARAERAQEEARRQAIEGAIDDGVAGALVDLDRERMAEEAARKALADGERLMARERERLQRELARADGELARMNQELAEKTRALEDVKRELERLRWMVTQEQGKVEKKRETAPPPR